MAKSQSRSTNNPYVALASAQHVLNMLTDALVSDDQSRRDEAIDLAKRLQGHAYTLFNIARRRAQPAPARVCGACGDAKPADRSCDCFDNGCQ